MDPVTLAVLKGRLESIADEMDATLFHADHRRRARHLSRPVEAGTSATLVQGRFGLPIFVGVPAFATKAATGKFPDAAESDVFLFNGP